MHWNLRAHEPVIPSVTDIHRTASKRDIRRWRRTTPTPPTPTTRLCSRRAASRATGAPTAGRTHLLAATVGTTNTRPPCNRPSRTPRSRRPRPPPAPPAPHNRPIRSSNNRRFTATSTSKAPTNSSPARPVTNIKGSSNNYRPATNSNRRLAMHTNQLLFTRCRRTAIAMSIAACRPLTGEAFPVHRA